MTSSISLISEGHEIPTVLQEKALALMNGGDWDDAGPKLAVELGGEVAGGLNDIDDEYRWAGVEDPKVVITTSRDPSSKLKQFAKVRNHKEFLMSSVLPKVHVTGLHQKCRLI